METSLNEEEKWHTQQEWRFCSRTIATYEVQQEAATKDFFIFLTLLSFIDDSAVQPSTLLITGSWKTSFNCAPKSTSA